MNENIIYKDNYDVIVVGGGIAGIAAAVSAARNHMKVLLIEKSVNLGGLATAGLISWYEPLCDGEGEQIIYGLAEELIKLSVKYGFDNLPRQWGGSGKNKPRNERFSTFYSPTVFSAALDKFVIENGVKVRFDSLATYPIMEDNHCNGVTVESVNGCEYFEGKMIIDATGDALLMHRAGVPTVIGQNYMSYIVHYYDVETADKLTENHDVCAFRKWMNTGSDMFGKGHPKGMRMLTGVTTEDITEYVIAGKLNLINHIEQKDKNSFDIMAIPAMPQFRTIRRIVGKCDFNAVDGETYSDSIGSCGDFRPNGEGKHYQIPAGALYNEHFDNMIASGRIISSPQGNGWEVARVIPVCALTGEAAGRMAALCINKNISLNELEQNDIEQISICN